MRLITCILFLILSQVCKGQTVELIMDQNPTNNNFAETIYENGVYTASGRLYFPLKTGNDYQICRIGGTDTTVTTINLNEPLNGNAPTYIVALNDKVFIFTSANTLIYDETLDSSYNFLGVLPTNHNFWQPFTLNEKSIFVDNGKLVILCLPKTGVNAQIWKTDGTNTGTSLFSTISGLTSSGVYNLLKETTALNTYFFNVGSELFMVDRVTGVSSKANVYVVSSFVELNGMLYFAGITNSLGSELWKTDGTALGTSLVYEFYPGSTNGLNNEPQRIGSLLYMVASNPTYGNEYWKSDGTTSGTKLLKDIVSGSSYQQGPTIIYNNYLYYSHSTTEIRSVNIFDTTMVKNYNHSFLGNSPQLFFISNGTLFFIMQKANPSSVKALYKINSNDVIELVYNLSNNANPSIGAVKLWYNKFYFSIDNKLLLSDGTTAGTHFVRNFKGQVLNYNEIRWSKHIGNEIYMFHYIPHLIDSISFVKLNNSDTIISLVKKLTYFHPNMLNIGFSIFEIPNSLNGFYFRYEIPSVYETGFWKSNGTTIGTKRVLHLIPQGNKDGYFSSFYSWKQKAYFTTVKNMGTPNAITYLHQSDGTSKGTFIMTQRLKSFNLRYAEFNNKLYFTSLDTLYSCTVQPNSVNAVYGFPSQKLYILSTSSKIFLLTNENPKKLYVSNGTALGTALIYTFSNSQTYDPEFIEFNNQAFFRINGALWKSDGTTGGTVLVKDFSFLGGTLNPIVLNGFLLFNGSVGFNNRLMKTDGTTIGTVAVSTFNNYAGDVSCNYQTLFKGKVFFEAIFENTPLRKLYSTDATSAGTMVVSSQPAYGFQYLRAVGNKLFFAGTEYLVSPELWAYNSTNGITQKVLETIPGSSSALTNEFISVGNYLYYVNYHKQFGYELWRTDTNYNSRMIYDLLPGNYSSKPKDLFKVSDSLFFFTAYSPQYGYELYAMKTNKTGVNIIANEDDCPTSPITFTSSFFGKNPIIQYQWTINDTLVSTATQMQYIFKKYGTYVIKLITKNTASVIDTATYTYVNGKNFRVAMDVNDSIQCLKNNLFVFTDSSKVLSTTIGNRIWNMGDGTFYYIDSVVQHNYKSKGTYHVTLKIIGANSCVDSTVTTVRVNDDSVSTIQGLKLIQTLKITTHSVQKINGYQYHWTLNPMFGSIVSDPDSSTVQIQWLNNSGSTILNVEIINTQGCSRLIEDTILLVSLKAAFSINDQSQCLPGNLFVFNDLSIVSGISNISRTWRLGNGVSYSDTTSIQYSYSSIGDYQVWLIVKGPYNIADSVMQVIYINNNTINAISGNDSVLISTSETYTVPNTSGNNYLWYLKNNLGVIASGSLTNSIMVQWGANAGADTLKVFVEDSNSCSVTISYPIQLYSISGVQYAYSKGPLVYPNPVNDKLTFSQLQSDDWNLSIYSSIGSMITQTTIKGMSGDVDVSEFPSGIYFYLIGNSTRAYTGKFVKD